MYAGFGGNSVVQLATTTAPASGAPVAASTTRPRISALGSAPAALAG
jgi:hypothetical protein